MKISSIAYLFLLLALIQECRFEDNLVSKEIPNKQIQKPEHHHRYRSLSGRPTRLSPSQRRHFKYRLLKVIRDRYARNRNTYFKARRTHSSHSHFKPNFFNRRQNNHRSRKNQQVQIGYSGSAATFKTVPDLLVIIQGISTIYNNLFSPINDTMTQSPSTLQTAINYMNVYTTLFNFALAFSNNRTEIENQLTSVLTATQTVQFTKTETLAFYGYLDLYNTLKISIQAFQPPFLAQDLALTMTCSNLTLIMTAIQTDLKTLFSINEQIQELNNGIPQNPNVANSNQVMQGLAQINGLLLTASSLLTAYVQADAAIQDIKFQMNQISTLRDQIKTIMENMSLIVYGTKNIEQVSGVSRVTTFSLLVAALSYVVMF